MSNAKQFGLIRLSASQLQHPELLTGLEIWMQIGLLSPAQVEQFCQQNLVCQLAAQSESRLAVSTALSDFADAVPMPVAQAASGQASGQEALVQEALVQAVPPANWPTRMLQAFMAEIGVIWLLCLGVFMVVVSSGVLAASQWQNFSAVGQYLILFAYTLAFWGASRWSDRQPSLRLTGQMLQIATLLLVPVNFWMMDSLDFWQQGAARLVNLLAVVLSGIIWSLLPRGNRLLLVNLLGLSWLHWGWSIPGMPLLATYLGTVGTAVLTYQQAARQAAQHSEAAGRTDLAGYTETRAAESAGSFQLGPSALVIGLATLLLIGRAVLAAQVPLAQLGLAFGLCGWLFCWLTRRSRFQLTRLWSNLGIGLLLLGWAVSVSTEPPWQAVAVSGLGLWLLGDLLFKAPSVQPVPSANLQALAIAFFLLGLQTYLLLGWLVPQPLRQLLIERATERFGVTGMPLALLGLAGFPYLWLMLGLMLGWARRQQNVRLSKVTQTLGLGLGSLLLLLGCWNPLVRSLVCLLAAGTLVVTLRQLAASWLYICHLLILAAGFSWVTAVWPDLSWIAWARILLVTMVLEWSLSLGHRRWQQTGWPIGLGMAGLSYALLSQAEFSPDFSQSTLIWLVTPIWLTGLSRLRHPQARQAAGFSTIGLIAQLALLNSASGWVIACAVGVILMLVNMLLLRTVAAALLTFGFGFGFASAALHSYFADQLSFGWVMLLLSTMLWLLWLLQAGLRRFNRNELLSLYAEAGDYWAVGLTTLSLISLSFYCVTRAASLMNSEPLGPETALLALSSLLLASTIAAQIWRQGDSELSWVGLGWATELLVILLVIWQNGSAETLAALTLGLGLATQLAGDWASRRFPARAAWHWLPLAYAGFGLSLGHVSGLSAESGLTATSGFYTLAAALIGLGVGRRSAGFKAITVLALLLTSAAAYELLIYQLTQESSGRIGDGLTLLAGLAALIAGFQQLCQRRLSAFLQLKPAELRPVRHLHWGLGSGLILLSLVFGLGQFWLWLLVGAALSTYALVQGRETVIEPARRQAAQALLLETAPVTASGSSDSTDLWVYLGGLQAVSLISAALYRWMPDAVGLSAWISSLTAVIAIFLYFSPWRNWGWNPRPWRQMALLLPALSIMLTSSQIALQSLLIVAAFYGWIAKAERQPRLSYLGLLLLNWALLRYLDQQEWLNLTWTSAVLAGSLLYVTQVDPGLQGQSARQQRHWLRSFAVGMLSLTLLYQAELEANIRALGVSLITLIGAIGLMGLGLVLRVRAFLYVGTATFVVRIIRLLWLFVDSYSLLLWAIGIVVGLGFIWIAATFEARRSQVGALMQYWLSEFERWE